MGWASLARQPISVRHAAMCITNNQLTVVLTDGLHTALLTSQTELYGALRCLYNIELKLQINMLAATVPHILL